jgi:uncharacterized damage-inducible protein DinB
LALNESFLLEFDHEMANTRKMLERIPEDIFGWKPHPKSFSMIELASHLVNIPSWTPLTFASDSMDVMPGGKPLPQRPPADSRAELVARFDKNTAEARAALSKASDEQLLGPWTLISNGKVMYTLPRTAMLRGFIFSHNIHHRAQLGMYLRLNEVSLPAMYGPSADEGGM